MATRRAIWKKRKPANVRKHAAIAVKIKPNRCELKGFGSVQTDYHEDLVALVTNLCRDSDFM